MATYAIGDVHGCYDQLQSLLTQVKFDPKQDTLWFTGDLINGGPKSVETLRFIKSLGDRCITVLGNHDLVLLGLASGRITKLKDEERIDGFTQVLEAADKDELISWLGTCKMVHYDTKFNALLVHAGVLPQWDLTAILKHAAELETVIHGPKAADFYAAIFGNLPDVWDDNLSGNDRLRFIVNCFTRMRFCDANGKLNLTAKGQLKSAPAGYYPWFTLPNKHPKDLKIIFGHWAALVGETEVENMISIDTGCMWGHSLTALRLDDWQKFSVEFNI
jgi:bis(5'-nucleosyl)-tetraphosphatase (symmetrical)